MGHWSFFQRNHELYHILEAPTIINDDHNLKNKTGASSWDHNKSSYRYFDTFVFQRITAMMSNESIHNNAK